MKYRLSKEHISSVIAMAICIKLKLPGLNEKDVLLTQRQYVSRTAATSSTSIAINTITSNSNTTTVTSATVMLKGMKRKCLRNFEGKMN